MSKSIVYPKSFFSKIDSVSISTAREIVPFIIEKFNPKSVVDVGCGSGAWLKIFKERGVYDLCGYDGIWAKPTNLCKDYAFIDTDLNFPLTVTRKFDLAVCIEVGEHLLPESAPVLVRSLIALSDIVVFSAAVPQQGGINHLNEQWPTFWFKIFNQSGFEPFDVFRHTFWDNEDVEPCVAQNIWLFIKKDSSAISFELMKEILNLSSYKIVNAINPRLYKNKLQLVHTYEALKANVTLKMLLRMLPGALYNFFRHHLNINSRP